MKLNMKRVGICFLFCLIFIVLNSVSIFAEDYLCVPNNDITNSSNVEEWTFYNSYDSEYLCKTQGSVSVYNLGTKIQEYYLNWFREVGENGFSELTLPTFKVVYWNTSISFTKNASGKVIGFTANDAEYETSFNLLTEFQNGELKKALHASQGYYDVNDSYNNNFGGVDKGVVIILNLGDTEYKIKTYSALINKVDTINESVSSFSFNKFVNIEGKNKYKSYENIQKILDYFRDCALRGIVAGSVEYSYNIGAPYSSVQRPLSDLMELKDLGYEFKKGSTVGYTFSYFYNPILGMMYLNQEPYLPTMARAITLSEESGENISKEDLWLEAIKNNRISIFGSQYTNSAIKLSDNYLKFVNNLSEENVNTEGIKLVDFMIPNGAVKYQGAKDPKNALSYNVQMAVPYIFGMVGGSGKLVTSNLRIIDNYIYCLYNDCIYDSNMNRIASMEAEVGTMRENIYLFNQMEDGANEGEVFQKGVALIGVFDECIVDTSVEIVNQLQRNSENRPIFLKNLYLTGRKIGFDNGYSDSLNIWDENKNLLYVTGESGKQDYLPLNVFFPTDIAYTEANIFLGALNAQVAASYPELTDNLRNILSYPKGDTFFFDLWNLEKKESKYVKKQVHGEIPSTIRAVKLYIDFGEIINQDKVVMVPDGNGGEKETIQSGASKYAFYCIRNNAYISSDGDLIDWLNTDKAKSLTYVNASGLLKLIRGNFTDKLSKLSYSDWKQMKLIEKELQSYKDMWLVRVMNVMSILMGVVLIVFAVLFMLAYWIDIFNTFSKASILQMISFGNMYPVAEKDTIEMLPDRGGKVKYVTFKDVLILGLIMIAVGVLFLNVESLVMFIVDIYEYIMFLFGRAK